MSEQLKFQHRFTDGHCWQAITGLAYDGGEKAELISLRVNAVDDRRYTAEHTLDFAASIAGEMPR